MEQNIQTLIQNNSHSVDKLSSQMMQLKVIQGAVDRLFGRINEITDQDWHKDSDAAYLSILEIQDTMHLITIGFFPLYMKMQETMSALEKKTDELFTIVVEQEDVEILSH